MKLRRVGIENVRSFLIGRNFTWPVTFRSSLDLTAGVRLTFWILQFWRCAFSY